MAGEAAAAVERAHELYRGGRHQEALELYSAALAAARGPAQRIALHSNRAACYLKLHDFCQAAEECTSVLELDREHAGALMLRAQTLVTLKDYQSALFDVNRLIEINPASEVYRNLHARLKTQLSLAPIPECEEESLHTDEDKEELPSKQDQKIENSITRLDQPASESSSESKPSNEQILERKPAAVPQKVEAPSTLPSKSQGWESIPKPKGHSGLDYSKWDRVEDDSSDDEDDNEEEQLPQYKFKVRTVGVRSVK
ncbi:hypothetical protein QOZ80_4AG0303970 [Eleusine coracana subsp. coracana]|nr:hypothetical protein QOZ80_4AG0303970 [Eleusine coracana subsp. coracana]